MSVRFLIILLLFNMSGVHGTRTLLTLYSVELGAAPVVIGMLAACFGIVPLLFSWTSGKLADRFGSRWLMLWGVAGSALGILLPFFLPGVPALMAAAICNGLTTTFCNVSLQTLVGKFSTPENRARNYSNFSLAGAMTNVVGPLAAGFGIDLIGYQHTCVLMFGIFLLPVVLLATRGHLLPPGSGEPAASGGLRELLAVPGVGRAMAASGIGQVGADFFQIYLPVYARALGHSASTIGIILACFSLAQFASRVFMPGLIARFNEQAVLAYAFGVAAAAFALIPFCEQAWAIGTAAFLTGLGMGFSRPISMMMMYAHSPAGRSAEAMGLRLTAENMTRMVGPVVFGAIASAAGLGAIFWLNALMMGAGGHYLKRGDSTRERG